MKKKTKNAISLIIGIILILAGLTQTSITLLKFGINWFSVPPIFSLVIGTILAIMGANRVW